MALIVIGRHGLVGGRLTARAGTGSWSTTHHPGDEGPLLDLLRPDAFDYDTIKAGDTVVIAGAVAAPDACARDPERARLVNVEGTVAVAKAAAARGARVIVFSSDTVYGETQASADETAPLRPHGAYAEMKLAMEVGLAGVPFVRVLRLSYVVHRHDGFLDYLADCAARGVVAEIFDPFDRCVVDIDDVVDAVLGLAADWDCVPSGPVNVGGPELLSRIQMARVVQQRLLPALQVRAMPAPAGFFVNRPPRIDMASPLLPVILGRPSNSYERTVIREWPSRRQRLPEVQ